MCVGGNHTFQGLAVRTSSPGQGQPPGSVALPPSEFHSGDTQRPPALGAARGWEEGGQGPRHGAAPEAGTDPGVSVAQGQPLLQVPQTHWVSAVTASAQVHGPQGCPPTACPPAWSSEPQVSRCQGLHTWELEMRPWVQWKVTMGWGWPGSKSRAQCTPQHPSFIVFY